MTKSKREVANTTAAAAEPERPGGNPDEASIAALAYQLWLAKGCPIGSDQDDWFLAEGILKARREQESLVPK